MSNSLKELVSLIQFKLDLSQEQIADRIGYSRPYLTNAIKNNTKGKIVDKINREFADIIQNVSSEGETGQSYTSKRRDQKNTREKKDVPVRGGFTNLSNITVYRDDPEQYEIVGTLPQNLFPGCDHAERAKGDSMYPLIMNQALLVGKKCSAKGIVMGEKYIIKTKEGLDTTKFIHPGTETGTIKLKAHNKSIPDQEIELSEIVFICRVTWIINPT